MSARKGDNSPNPNPIPKAIVSGQAELQANMAEPWQARIVSRR